MHPSSKECPHMSAKGATHNLSALVMWIGKINQSHRFWFLFQNAVRRQNWYKRLWFVHGVLLPSSQNIRCNYLFFFFNGLKKFEYQNQFHHEKTRKPVCYIVVISKNSTKKDFEEFFNQQCLQLNQTIHSLKKFLKQKQTRYGSNFVNQPCLWKIWKHIFSSFIQYSNSSVYSESRSILPRGRF